MGIIEIRDSKITGFQNIEVEAKLDETPEEILEIIVASLESSYQVAGEKIGYILPLSIESLFLGKKAEVPQIGGKVDMLKLCYKNIYEYAQKKYLASLSTKSQTKKTQENILTLL